MYRALRVILCKLCLQIKLQMQCGEVGAKTIFFGSGSSRKPALLRLQLRNTEMDA